MENLTFLGNTFFGNDVGSLVVSLSLYSAASAGLDRHQALSLNDFSYSCLSTTASSKRLPRRVSYLTYSGMQFSRVFRHEVCLMRAWLAGIMLAIRSQALLIFGLWLAVI